MVDCALLAEPRAVLHLRDALLVGARRELKSRAGTDTVQDVAARWGFWHMGAFASDYRRQFGERPSDTGRIPSSTYTLSLPGH